MFGIVMATVILVRGEGRGIFTDLRGFEAKVFAIMVILFSLALMSNVYFNKRDKDISLPAFLIIGVILPFLELLANAITRWLGK